MFRLFQPHVFQGPKKLRHKKGYFEGWYYKFVSLENRAFAVIPGVSLKKENSLAFIQTIDGNDGKTTYTTFPIEEFQYSLNPFSVSIGGNFFSYHSVDLGDRVPVSGKIKMIGPRKYRTTLLRPGIMGWYRYVPAMECYHGVVSSGHKLDGDLFYNNETLNFHDGSGYMEKDWGTSFPSSYIWMQSNSFKEEDHSFMLSVARIPWFGSSFRGFLGFLDLGSKIITFSTYTGAQLTIDSFTEDSVCISIVGRGSGGKDSLKKGELVRVRAFRESVGLLMAPQTGSMDRRIGESIDAEIHVEFFRDGKALYEGKTMNSGLEIVGDRNEL